MKRIDKRVQIALLSAVAALIPVIAPGQAYGQSQRERQLAARDHVNQGNYLMGQNHFPEAIEEYKKALEIDPTNSIAKDNIITCHINWGNYYVRQRKYPEALKEYQTCLILNPYNAKALNNINVVKTQMARDAAASKARGEGGEGQPEGQAPPAKAGGAGQPKKEQPSAVILTPGIKTSKSGSGEGGGESPQPSASYGEGGEGGTGGEAPAASGGTEAQTPPASPPAATRPVQPPAPARPPAAGTAPAGAAGAAGSLEDLLAAVEVKIYGRKQADLPVLKRLEKLETDTAGATRTGTIKERIDFLRKNYGL